ncbi:hypothetical protein KYY02_07645 [Streptomyces pimonensis]|uniref:Uncharacterized protein n=1 Tax=Streptomyces pimonensis TaxID=2860288 RepID=A0ABV4IZF1_9ACTN
MGIRMLHRRAAPPRSGGPTVLPPVPVFAAAASTARTPATLATALRNAMADLGRRTGGRRRTGRTLTTAGLAGGQPPWRLWAELARAHLALALTLLPRPRPVRTVTVFVAASDPLGVRPYGSAAVPRRSPQPPWPDAAP